jgi:hypothetical protein
MPDDRYLDGDPRADENRFLFTDLTPFVQSTEQDFALLVELIEAGRRRDALSIAEQCRIRAEMVLEQLEAPKFPSVDIEETADVVNRCGRVYKRGGQNPA